MIKGGEMMDRYPFQDERGWRLDGAGLPQAIRG
jgi:hypothetical protein